MEIELAKSIVLFLLNIPADTKMEAVDLYMEWQKSGGRIHEPDKLVYILYYFNKMKNQDRALMREIAVMDGLIREVSKT